MKKSLPKGGDGRNAGHEGRKANSEELVAWAERYIKVGFKVFLTAPGTKVPLEGSHGSLDATDDISVIRKLAKKYPDANLAVATGSKSGIIVIDIDLYKSGARELFVELEALHGELPATRTVQTARGGEHRFFRCKENAPNWQSKFGVGVDVRGDGGYVVVQPSVFQGKKYRWLRTQKKWPQLPKAWLTALRDGERILNVRDLSTSARIPKGSRNGTLFNAACVLKRQRETLEDTLKKIRGWNQNLCDVPLSDADVVGIVSRAFKTATTTVDHVPLPSRPVRKTKTLADIDNMKLKPLVWALRGILPAGVALIAGAPKIGKSLLVLQMGLAISVAGALWKGRKKEKRGEVLYLSYEDSDRRLKKRARQLMDGKSLPKRFHVDYVWPRMDQGGIEDLDNWLGAHPKVRLVIIDTLAKFRSEGTTKRTAYDYDYATGSALVPIAERHQVAIVLVHHTAKAKRPDVLDSINSTNGLPGGVDTIMVLGRERGTCDGSLFVTGRDITKERHLAMKKDDKKGWLSMGNLEDVMRSPERKAILEVLKRDGSKRPKELSALIGKPDVSIRQLLMKMVSDGEVTCVDGVYSV